jgi:hypothetical protein
LALGLALLLLAAALGAGGAGDASAAAPAGLLPAGLAAVLLGAAGAGDWAGQRLAAFGASAVWHIVTRRLGGAGKIRTKMGPIFATTRRPPPGAITTQAGPKFTTKTGPAGASSGDHTQQAQCQRCLLRARALLHPLDRPQPQHLQRLVLQTI